MSHNPIIKQTQLGMHQPEIGRTQQGILQYQGRYRQLGYGVKLSFAELLQLRNSTLYIVDCRAHDWVWDVQLPSQDDERPFRFRLEITYRVADAELVVRQNVSDIERSLQQKLLPDLRILSGRARLHLYKEIARRVQETILHHSVFYDCGLEREGEVRVTALLTEAEKKFIAELEQLIAAQSSPRHATCTGSLPTQQASYKFEVEVDIQYLLVDEQRNRSLADLAVAVDVLWKTKIHKALRRISAKYSYKQVSEADAALDNVLDQEEFADYGIRVVSATARLRLDDASRKAAEEDEQTERKREQEKAQKQHIRSNVMPNRMDLLASMYERGEMTLREMLQYMDNKELEAAGVPLDLIAKLKELDILDRDVAEDTARALLTSTLAAAATKQVPGEANELLLTLLQRAQLPGKIDSTKPNVTTADKFKDDDDDEM